MFGVLVESNPRPRGRRVVTMASLAVHAGLILLGAWATAESAAPISADDREVMVPEVLTHPAPVPRTERRPARLKTQSPVTIPVPETPSVPPLPGFEVPEGLPPIEQLLGDPFVTAEYSAAVLVDGVDRGGDLSPGSVLDNLIAEKPALPLPSNAPPDYPEALRSAGIEGSVEVEFIIDPNGRLRPGSIVARRADHPRFLEAVRAALADHRYLPAEAGGSPVAVRVRQRFAFLLQ